MRVEPKATGMKGSGASALLAGRRDLVMYVTLAAASGASVMLLLMRRFYLGQPGLGFLIWNLALAWAPLGFALVTAALYGGKKRVSFPVLAGGVMWLLFFPNGAYIVTDLVHLRHRAPVPIWWDIFLFMSFAGTGFLLGFASLEIMRRLVTAAAGRAVGWLFATGVLLAAAFGIYLGRFVRLNSWEPLTSPVECASEIARAMGRLFDDGHAFAFVALCAGFLFLGHGALHAISFFQPRCISRREANESDDRIDIQTG